MRDTVCRLQHQVRALLEAGNESLSRFIRDYRKMFGAAPREDIANLRKGLKK